MKEFFRLTSSKLILTLLILIIVLAVHIAFRGLLNGFCSIGAVNPILLVWIYDYSTRNMIIDAFNVILLNCTSTITDVVPFLIQYYFALVRNFIIIFLISLSYFLSCLIISYYRKKNNNILNDPSKEVRIKGKYIFNFLLAIFVIMFYEPYIVLLNQGGLLFYILIPIIGCLFIFFNFSQKLHGVFKGDLLSKSSYALPDAILNFFKPTINKIRLTLIIGSLTFVVFGIVTGYFNKPCELDEYPYPIPGRMVSMIVIEPFTKEWFIMQWNKIWPFLDTPCPPSYYNALLIGTVRVIIVAFYMLLIYLISSSLLMVYKSLYSKDESEQKAKKGKLLTKIIYASIFLFIFVILYIPNHKQLLYIYNENVRKSNVPPPFTDEQKNFLTQKATEIIANKYGITMETLQITNARAGNLFDFNKRVYSIKAIDSAGKIYGITVDDNGQEVDEKVALRQNYEAKIAKYGKFDPNFYEKLLLEDENRPVRALIGIKMPYYEHLPRPAMRLPDDGNNPTLEEIEELNRKEKELNDSHFEPVFDSFVEKFKTKGYDFSNDRDGLYEVKMSFKELKEIQNWEEIGSIFQ